MSSGIRGPAVQIAREIAQHAHPDEILVSSTIRDLVPGSGIRFQHRGFVDCEELSGGLQLLVVEPAVTAVGQRIQVAQTLVAQTV
jgi:hypothetical protein